VEQHVQLTLLNAYLLSNGHSPQIRQNGELLVRMCRGEPQKVSKSPLANVSECIESGESGWRMLGECIESGETGWRMAGECIESGENGWRMAGECIESNLFSKKSILASTQIRQIR
jgi:hypothetical protein